MEGLSATASGIAVVFVAMHLVESFKKLCDFWKSIKEVSEDIQTIFTDLEFFSSVLIKLAFQAQYVDLNETLIIALNGCYIKVKIFITLLNIIEPGVISTRFRVLRWSALKTVMRHEELIKFQEVSDSLKSTLLLVLQDQSK